jgi:Cu+-exporting ATPase
MSKVKEEGITKCYHCGENCNGSIVFNAHPFCCEGCKTVFEILNENNLCDFYSMNETPGASLKDSAFKKRFGYLDDELVKSKLIKFSDGKLSVATFYIPKIHCSSCIYLLENLHRINATVNRSVIHFTKREATITFDNTKISLRGVVELLASIGYEPTINLNDLDNSKRENHLRQYYIKIAIAFFAFGNMMLLSFPEYLGLNAVAESPFRKFFGYGNFLLALPVMFYCAEEFFVSAWNAARHKSLNMDVPIVLGIVAMFTRSSYEIFSHTGAGYFDTLGSLILLMLIGRFFQNKTYDTLSFERDYKSYFPVAVSVFNNGNEKSIPLSKLRMGDRILIRNMELVPADSVLMSKTANIDYSFVTGEATPISKKSGDIIYAGGKHIGSAIELEVMKEVSHSYLTQLWNDSVFEKTVKENVSTLATKVSKWFTPIVLLIATSALIFWWKTDLHKALNAFTSVLIITCPCALALSSPFTLGNILRLLSRKHIYLKNPVTVEKLAQLNAIVFDKTGTLTNTKEAKIDFIGEQLSSYEQQLVKSLVYHSSHPLSKKVNELLKETKIIPTEDFAEAEGKGIEGWVDEHCVRIGSKKYLYGENYPGVNSESDFRHASKVFVGIDGEVKGFYLVKNEYRKGFAVVVASLKKHFKLFVVSGDNDAEKNFLKQHVNEENLIFHQQPADKLNFVKLLQQQGKNVMMIGDGLNDAGALKQADVGMVISDDINNFSPACDGIIDSEQFEKLPDVLNYSRTGVTIIKTSFIISLLYNCLGIYLAVQGTMSPIVAAILMPVSSVTIISFTTIASTIYVQIYFPADINHRTRYLES